MSSPNASREPRPATLRVGGASEIPTVASKFGVDADELLADAGLDSSHFDDPDNLITLEARDRLMALCAAKTGCSQFGLLVGQRMDLQSLGLVGLLARCLPDVEASLRSLEKYMHLHSQGTVLKLSVDGKLAVVTYDISQPGKAIDHLGDAAVAMLVKVMRALCGPDFQPLEVRFAHHKPSDVQPFRRFFQVPLWFEADHFAIVFSRDWLKVEPTGTDAELQRLLQKQIDTMEKKHSLEFPDQVRGVLRSALLTGHSSLGEVSAIFSMPSWTFSRRLAESDTHYQKLVDECRYDIARRMLEGTTLEIRQISESLGYARSSMFTRAFRRWSGTTPTRWRARIADET